MALRAWIYIWAVLALGGLLGVLSVLAPQAEQMPWVAWLVLTGLTTLTQLFKTLLKSKLQSDNGTTSYSPSLVFLFAGVLLLPAPLFILQVIVPHLVEWLRERFSRSANLPAWYIQPFNMGTHVVAGLVTWWFYRQLLDWPFNPSGWSSVIPVALAALLYAFANHLLVGGAMVLARGVSWRESGCLQPQTLFPDFVMLGLGGAIAKLWEVDPWLIMLLLSILVLVYRALQVPQLQKEAQTDGKTGLLNARRFAELANAEIERAKRFDHPIALIMADLDLLRDVNNNYGHLAGDAVLTSIGQIIRSTIRDYDLAGRFGGEEFAIVLPEVGMPKALAFAERLRQAVEAANINVSTSVTPLKVTMSLGVACYPDDGTTLAGLTHEADVAVYQAKLHGRNRVVAVEDVPRSVRLDASTQPGHAAPFTHPTADSAAAVVVAAEVIAARAGDNARAQETVPAAAPVPTMSDAAAAAQPGGAPDTEAPARRPYPRGRLGVFLGVVIAAGLGSALFGTLATASLPEPTILLLIVVMTVLSQMLLADSLKSSTSVAGAVAFAAGLIAGIPGAVIASTATVPINHWRKHQALHVTAFNWSVHVLAGWAPVLLLVLTGLKPRADTLILLMPFTVVAALVYFAVETGLVAWAISLSSRSSLINTWRDQFQWFAPHYIVLCLMGMFLAVANAEQGALGVIVFCAPVFMMRFAQHQYVEHTRASMQELQRMNWELTQANQEVETASTAIRKLNDELFLTLAKILDARDPYVSGHSTQVATYAAAIATEMGLPPERIAICRQAGFLHDIGKIAIAEEILNKPGKLTAQEYDILKAHATIGAELIETSQGLRHLAPFVRHHHEHWDGRGYPAGLRREQIPLEARILAVCDAVEAMASDRPYKKAKSIEEIMAEVRRCSGTQFDPAIAEIFIRLVEREGDKLVINSALEVVRRQVENRELVLVEAGLVVVQTTAA